MGRFLRANARCEHVLSQNKRRLGYCELRKTSIPCARANNELLVHYLTMGRDSERRETQTALETDDVVLSDQTRRRRGYAAVWNADLGTKLTRCGCNEQRTGRDVKYAAQEIIRASELSARLRGTAVGEN